MHMKQMQVRKKLNQGFTLVELIVSIAVLGIIVVPILTYFTNANKFNAKAKQMQKASNAAQSVLEEVESYSTFQSYNALFNDDGSGVLYNAGGRRAGSSAPSGSAEDDQFFYTLPVNYDGMDYITRISVDYRFYDLNTNPSVCANKFNQYETPNIGVLYSEKNAIAMEEQQLSNAIDYFFYYHNETVTKNAIRSSMRRKAFIEIKESPTDVNKVIISSYYKYTYGTVTITSSDLCNSEFAKADLEKIYWFYCPYDSSDDELVIICSDTLGGVDYDLYVVRQNMTGVTLNSDYKVSITCSALTAGSIKGVYSNNESVFINGGNPVSLEGLVTTEKKKRISQVTVSVYPGDSTVLEPDKALATVISTKGE